MAVPKRKKSRSRRDMRRSHDALNPSNIFINSQNKAQLRHYRGKEKEEN